MKQPPPARRLVYLIVIAAITFLQYSESLEFPAALSDLGLYRHSFERILYLAPIAVFRICQEALRNVWRHSGATEVNISIEFAETKTRLIIEDNGKGFEIPDKLANMARNGKLGLTGMQERAQLIGGTLEVASRPGRGTKILLELTG